MQLIFHEKLFSAKISLASRGDAKNKGIFNSIDLKNPIKNVGHQPRFLFFTTSETA